MEDMVELTDTDLTVAQRDALPAVLRKYDPMFDGHIGHTDLVIRIDTGDNFAVTFQLTTLQHILSRELTMLWRPWLAGSSYFCVLDINSAHHQISIKPSDRMKTAITTPFGSWQYKRMCFGLSSAPFTCARLLNIVLGDMSPHACVTYFDDIIVHGKSVEEVLTSLDSVALSWVDGKSVQVSVFPKADDISRSGCD